MADKEGTRQSSRSEAMVAEQTQEQKAFEKTVEEETVKMEKEAGKDPLIIRKIGRESGMKDTKKAIVFLSYAKDLMLFKDARYIIKFQSRQFITDNPKDVAWLRRHELNGKEFWEGEYPKSVLNRFKLDNEHIERSEDAFVPAEA